MSSLAMKSRSGPRQRAAKARSLIVYPMLAILGAVAGSGEVEATGADAPPAATLSASAGQENMLPSDRRMALEQVLKHIYAVYLGIRSCTEISVMQNDKSFRPEVSLDESRQVLRQVDAAAHEVGINSAQIWDAEAPIALITAEALKTHPETHLVYCQKMGSIFRVDAGNLQAGLAQAGAKTSIIAKDY